MPVTVIVIIAIIVVAVMAVAGPYNALVTLRQRYKNAFAQIDVQLKRRYDLIPNLVGGPTSELLGDKIAQRVFVDRNLPHASALSALLMLGVFLPFLLGYAVQKIRKCFVHKENNAESLQGEATK